MTNIRIFTEARTPRELVEAMMTAAGRLYERGRVRTPNICLRRYRKLMQGDKW